MKIKILSTVSSLLLGSAAIVLLNSSSGGVMGKATAGCSGSGCHAAKSTNTTITLTGIPTSGYVANQTYSMTLQVANSSKPKAGFDLLVSAGTIQSASSGTMPMGNELHHTTPGTAASGVTTWTFVYKAPATISGITFSVSANAVDGTGTAANDEWNNAAFNYTGSFAASVESVEESPFTLYPNPATDRIQVHGGQVNHLRLFNIFGQVLLTSTTNQLELASLANGTYFVMIEASGHRYVEQIVKQ